MPGLWIRKGGWHKRPLISPRANIEQQAICPLRKTYTPIISLVASMEWRGTRPRILSMGTEQMMWRQIGQASLSLPCTLNAPHNWGIYRFYLLQLNPPAKRIVLHEIILNNLFLQRKCFTLPISLRSRYPTFTFQPWKSARIQKSQRYVCCTWIISIINLSFPHEIVCP